MKKIIGILVTMLMIGAIVLPVVGSLNVSNCPVKSPSVIDQEQPDTSETHFIQGGIPHSQEFINQGNKIEKVEVHIGHYYGGSPPMTLSIEKPLGNKLTFVTLTTADIPDHAQNWCTFDFPDVALDKNVKYYIVIQSDVGSEYAWSGAHGDPYPAGASSHPDLDWDYAFRTIVDKSRPRAINKPFLNILQSFSDLFPILKILLHRLG